MSGLTRIEIAALIAVVRLEPHAYGVAIHEDLEGFLGRPVSLGATYSALKRLTRRALLRTTVSAPLAVQGGRAKRLYATTSSGRTFLRHEQVEATRLWQALPRRFNFDRPRLKPTAEPDADGQCPRRARPAAVLFIGALAAARAWAPTRE